MRDILIKEVVRVDPLKVFHLLKICLKEAT